MSLIKKWKAEKNRTSIDDFTDACTPRPPKPEWFEKWKSWRITDKDGRMYYLANCKYIDRTDGHRIDGCAFHELRFTRRIGDSIAQPPLVLPVDLQGMPVGWQVLEVVK